MVKLLCAGVIALAFLSPTMASAEMTAPKRVIGSRMTPNEVEYWITMATKFSRYEKPFRKRPTIEIVPEDVFVKEFCPVTDPDAERSADEPCTLLGVRFFAEPDVLYVRSRAGWFPGSRGGVIVHELTHWLQHVNDLKDDQRMCGDAAAREVEAYAAGYLYEHKIEKKNYPYLVPDTYSECILYNQRAGRASPAPVVTSPTITKGAK